MSYPHTRLRRLRTKPSLRELTEEVKLHPSQLIHPLFIVPGENIHTPIASLPGQFHTSPDTLKPHIEALWEAGVRSVLLFGQATAQDPYGSEASRTSGALQQGIYAIHSFCPEMTLISDVCLCAYTNHGHCGILDDHEGEITINNDETLSILGDVAISHAEAGADIVAPSGNMDGMVGAIRQALDETQHVNTSIMAYSAKYASALYGPFREATGTSLQGDRKTYQLNPANAEEGMREIALDIEEGADIVMVKPAYPDIIHKAKQEFQHPLAAYHVSGEYAMIKAAGERGWLDADAAMLETILGIKRAGADLIISYAALDIAQQLK